MIDAAGYWGPALLLFALYDEFNVTYGDIDPSVCKSIQEGLVKGGQWLGYDLSHHKVVNGDVLKRKENPSVLYDAVLNTQMLHFLTVDETEKYLKTIPLKKNGTFFVTMNYLPTIHSENLPKDIEKVRKYYGVEGWRIVNDFVTRQHTVDDEPFKVTHILESAIPVDELNKKNLEENTLSYCEQAQCYWKRIFCPSAPSLKSALKSCGFDVESTGYFGVCLYRQSGTLISAIFEGVPEKFPQWMINLDDDMTALEELMPTLLFAIAKKNSF